MRQAEKQGSGVQCKSLFSLANFMSLPPSIRRGTRQAGRTTRTTAPATGKQGKHRGIAPHQGAMGQVAGRPQGLPGRARGNHEKGRDPPAAIGGVAAPAGGDGRIATELRENGSRLTAASLGCAANGTGPLKRPRSYSGLIRAISNDHRHNRRDHHGRHRNRRGADRPDDFPREDALH